MGIQWVQKFATDNRDVQKFYPGRRDYTSLSTKAKIWLHLADVRYTYRSELYLEVTACVLSMNSSGGPKREAHERASKYPKVEVHRESWTMRQRPK